MNTLQLAWMLTRAGGGQRRVRALTLGAYAVVSALVLIVVAGALSFTRLPQETAAFYLPLAGIAVVLLIVPLVLVGASAARLSARSQDRTLSTLRLLGATGGQVRAISVLQAVGTAALGALGGVLLYLACAPLVALVNFQGAPIGAGIFAPLPVLLAVLAAVLLLAAGSSLAGLRKLVISPLAVRQRVNVPRPSWVRAAIAVGGVGLIYMVFANLGAFAQSLATITLVLLFGLGIGLLVLNLIGPWLIAVIGRRKLAKAERPEQLLAARMILESPKALWRQVAPLAMAAFVAVVGGSGAALMSQSAVDPTGGWEDYIGVDLRTGVILTLAIIFACVAAATAITQAAGTLDAAELYQGLSKMGLDRATMNRARVQAVMIPALGAALTFAVASGVLLLPLVGIAMVMAPLSLALVLGTCVAGLVLVRLAVQLAAPSRMLAH
ncbi:FtsX-like permease family protein [Glutamicibacter endophyticus]|uniref:FtsX-like permease family protein n=1 Tax=Glutamicibacter endophyticus TaxID=1522174 RepID=UPI003AF0CD30